MAFNKKRPRKLSPDRAARLLRIIERDEPKSIESYDTKREAIKDELYDVAKKVCHDAGLPWTDPRTGTTHQPPKKTRKSTCNSQRNSR